jgi:hypothetical protein
MATLESVKSSLDKLAAAYGRRPMDVTYEAFGEALAEVDDNELTVATTRLLRGGGQFMPSTAEVYRAAVDYRQELRDRERHSDSNERRVTCLQCDDGGHVLTFQRHWLLSHREGSCASWFVSGWIREAYLWCLQNYREDLLQTVICDCECRAAKVFRQQIARWTDRDPTDKRVPYPAFRRWYDASLDCLIETPLPPYDRTAYLSEYLLRWRETDKQTRPWQGNWIP